MESRIDVRTVLDSTVHPMEYRVGFAHAHDANSYLFDTNVRVESGKGKNIIIRRYNLPLIFTLCESHNLYRYRCFSNFLFRIRVPNVRQVPYKKEFVPFLVP